jgi:UPF0042 nucleotide-binding protein
MRLVVITGLSGSGKSVALNVLEDGGFYCIDNLPAALLPETVQYLQLSGYQDTAVSIDARSEPSLAGLPEELRRLREKVDLRVLYLEAKEETLVKRYSETRRRHPLNTGERSLAECIREEREMLSPLVALAHHIDTSETSANALRTWIKDLLQVQSTRFTLVFESFGFKHGIPLDVDLVFDVRCLPNPHYDPYLRPLTGRDAAVIAFLQTEPRVQEMLEDIRSYVAKWLPAYIRDNRSYFTVALGCTGGRHRSVYFAETLADLFQDSQQVLIRHRELSG